MKQIISLLLFVLFASSFSCEKQKDFIFPDLPYLDSEVYKEIKKTCDAYWDLSNMLDDTFQVIPEGDEYAVHCDGYVDNILYHFVIRVDEYGKWINDGRAIKE